MKKVSVKHSIFFKNVKKVQKGEISFFRKDLKNTLLKIKE